MLLDRGECTFIQWYRKKVGNVEQRVYRPNRCNLIAWKRMRVKYQHLIRINVNEIFRLDCWRDQIYWANEFIRAHTLLDACKSDCDWQLREHPIQWHSTPFNYITFWFVQSLNFFLHSLSRNLVESEKKIQHLRFF